MITISAGPEKTMIYAHKHMLETSRFFTNCLNPSFKVGAGSEIQMLKKNPESLAMLVGFLYQGQLPKPYANECTNQTYALGIEPIVEQLTNLYVLANMIIIEEQPNQIFTTIFRLTSRFKATGATPMLSLKATSNYFP